MINPKPQSSFGFEVRRNLPTKYRKLFIEFCGRKGGRCGARIRVQAFDRQKRGSLFFVHVDRTSLDRVVDDRFLKIQRNKDRKACTVTGTASP